MLLGSSYRALNMRIIEFVQLVRVLVEWLGSSGGLLNKKCLAGQNVTSNSKKLYDVCVSGFYF